MGILTRGNTTASKKNVNTYYQGDAINCFKDKKEEQYVFTCRDNWFSWKNLQIYNYISFQDLTLDSIQLITICIRFGAQYVSRNQTLSWTDCES